METPHVRFSGGKGWRVSTPSFADCAVMDGFYAEAHRLIEKQFAERSGQGGRVRLAADFTVEDESGDTVIALRLRAREKGRVTARKTVFHRWRDGYIAPGNKSPVTIISKILQKHKRKSENCG